MLINMSMVIVHWTVNVSEEERKKSKEKREERIPHME